MMQELHRDSGRVCVWGLIFLLGLALGAAIEPCRAGDLPPLGRAQWIWSERTNSVCALRALLNLDTPPTNASILITADNGYELYINGSLVGSEVGAESEVWRSVERYDITSRLLKGRNTIGIQGSDLGGTRGVVAALRVVESDGKVVELVTDESWRAAPRGQGIDYSHPEFVEGPDWKEARVVGPMGMAPWGKVEWSSAAEKARSKRAQSVAQVVKPGANFAWPESVVFLGEDCSVYVPLRADAWGVAFRIGDWSRAYTEFDLPCPSKIGRKLYFLKPGPGAEPRLLFDVGAGAIGSPSATYDGRAVLVSMARTGEQFYHIYRIPLATGEPERLTEGPFHDLDPSELPDGRIVFASTRIGTVEEYHSPPSRALFVMDAEGRDIHPITSTPIFDNEPKVMADGRIVFVRSDNFFDRGKVETHLHVVRPDGTDGLTEVGANVGADYGVRLRAFGYGSPAPMPDGRLAFISNRGNFIASPGGRKKDFQRLPGSLGDLAALADGRLLCTVLRPDGRRLSSDVLGVIDPADERIVSIYESRHGAIHSPVFVGRRRRPPVLPSYVDTNQLQKAFSTGFLFCQNVRFTTKTKADWDHIREVRVLGAVPLTLRSSHSHIVHAGHETVELGTVPLAADGSFFVEVPADMPIALQAVDAEGRSELNEMSWIYVRPGERRSCIGCHNQRDSTPSFASTIPEALRTAPLKLTGQGNPHRFRGNNAGVTGLMDLQFERFRENASLNRHDKRLEPNASGRDDMNALLRFLEGKDEGQKISAAQRLAIYRSHEAAPYLAACLQATNREVRVASALALAACGTRQSVPPLVAALEDRDACVSQAAALALENITGHLEATSNTQSEGRAAVWRRWVGNQTWEAMERELVSKLMEKTEDHRRASVALGHIGGPLAAGALRKFVKALAETNPYPAFVKDNRTDNFTFAAASPWNPRTLQEAIRALGQLRDRNSVPMLRHLLAGNIEPRTGNLFMAEAAVEALGRIGTAEAEAALIETFASLRDYWRYVGWYSDHPALYACHASPLHARILEALDLIESTRAAPIVPQLIRSVPTDPDRALFADNDDYEILVGRLIRRSGTGPDVIETCLALLGDSAAVGRTNLQNAISATHPAWAGHPGPQNRAAQILSLVCRDPKKEPVVRAAFNRFRDMPEEAIQRALGNPSWTPVRHWVLFYLARTLGQLGQPASVETLSAVLRDDLNEARHGRPDPAQPEIHFLQLEYTPCWRAAAAWALGRIGESKAVPALIRAVRNLENATDVRHAAARALERLADPSSLPELRKLARDYPEVSTRRVLLATCEKLEGKEEEVTVARRSQ